MKVNGDFLEVDYYQKNKAGNVVCGDSFVSHKFREEGRVISVLSDGLGSGIKASVLSTITSSMLLNFSMMNEDIMDSAASVIKTLPQDEIRKISYSTFCICDVDCFGHVRIVEYESPSFYLFRKSEYLDVPKIKIPVTREDTLENTELWISEFTMQKEDRIVFFSDGVNQSGMGNRTMPFGWGDDVKDYISQLIVSNPEISAKEISRRIVLKAEQNDTAKLKDDTSCCALYMRNPRNLLVCTGPPYDEKNDSYLSGYVSGFPGKKIICGGTTARIVSRETDKPIEVDMDLADKDLPPSSMMDGIDLITEGILTLSKIESLLTDNEPDRKIKGPAEKLMKMLADSDKITFLVGTRINIAHQDPTLPVELEIRRNVVKKIKYLLETKWLKDVDITYI